MSELENVRFGGTCPYPGCIEPSGHPSIHPTEQAQQRVDELVAENARLQERVEEAEGGAKMLRQELDAASKREKTAVALAERRKEALERIKMGRMDIGGKDEAMPRAVMMSEALAALAQGKKE